MRRIYQGSFKDGNGSVVSGGSVTVYLAGTETLATIYAVSSGGSAVSGSVVTSANDGHFYFYVDTVDYPISQLFKITLSKTGYETNTYNDISILVHDLNNVNSIANLRALTGVEGSVASVLGYYTAGDGGGGPDRIWSASSTATDNGGSVIKPTAIGVGDPGRWLWAWSGAVNVKWFGSVGDGVADDYAAIQVAIDFIGEAGTVYFPAGVYAVSNTIKIENTNPYPSSAATSGDNKFITLKGDGMYASWLVHTGNQSTGCLQILGNANWFAGPNKYYPVNNGSSQVVDMALGSNYGPALTCQFANKQHHKNILLYSTGTTSYSLDIQSCIQSTFTGIEASGGNNSYPVDILAKVTTALPLGAISVAKHNIYVRNVAYDDGVHGSDDVICGELFFTQCRTDGNCTDTSVEISGSASASISETFLIKFSQCKFTGGAPTTAPEPWVVSVNGANWVGFTQCSFEPQTTGTAMGSLRVSSNYGSTSVSVEDCWQASIGYVDIGLYGAAGDNGNIQFIMKNSNFYTVRLNTVARDAGKITRLVLHNNLFDVDFDGSFAGAYTTTGVALIPDYSVLNNVISTSEVITSCSYQTLNNFKADNPTFRGSVTLDTGVLGNWSNVAFDATDFTSQTPSGGWTVDEADVIFNRFQITGKTLMWSLGIDTTTVASTPSNLQIKIPGGKTAKSSFYPGVFAYYNGTTWGVGGMRLIGTGNTLVLYPDTTFGSTNWPNGTDNIYVNLSVMFEVE